MNDKAPGPARVLVVDDEPAICELLTDTLRSDELKVEAATSATDAIKAGLACKPDLLVTDLLLGDGSGLDVIDRLREQFGDLPAVVITGHGSAERLSEASRRRPVELLNKPLDVVRLKHAIEGELARRRAHQQPAPAKRTPCPTCDDLTDTCRNLQSNLDRQEALIRYQTDLLGADTCDDVFRRLFGLFVERTGMLFGAVIMCDDTALFQLVGRFGVPVPDGVNFCRELAAAAMSLLEDRQEIALLDATDNLELFPEQLHRMLPGVSLLLIPLLTNGGPLIGAVVLYRKGEQPFTDDDIALAQMVIGPTTAAVQKTA